MAVGILIAMQVVRESKARQVLEDTIVIGELSLDGKINKINGILPIAIEAARHGMKRIILPADNAKEASIVENIEIIPVSHLQQVIAYLDGDYDVPKIESVKKQNLSKINSVDFSEVKGQENVKRALEIAAAGGHNCLLIRFAPAHGKTMLARRIPTILPEMTFEEALEVTKIHSIAGMLSKDTPMLFERPFRSPHHTISGISLVGGGRIPRPRRSKLSSLWSIVFREPQFLFQYSCS